MRYDLIYDDNSRLEGLFIMLTKPSPILTFPVTRSECVSTRRIWVAIRMDAMGLAHSPSYLITT